jgi:hypothetical protein
VRKKAADGNPDARAGPGHSRPDRSDAPDGISLAAVFLASDAANLVTGAEYEVTAGDSAKDV